MLKCSPAAVELVEEAVDLVSEHEPGRPRRALVVPFVRLEEAGEPVADRMCGYDESVKPGISHPASCTRDPQLVLLARKVAGERISRLVDPVVVRGRNGREVEHDGGILREGGRA